MLFHNFQSTWKAWKGGGQFSYSVFAWQRKALRSKPLLQSPHRFRVAVLSSKPQGPLLHMDILV